MFDYIFDNNPNRKVLRIAVSVTNIASYGLRDVRMEVSKTGKVLAVSPATVVVREFRAGEVLHMVIYLGEYSSNDRFIPFKIDYATESELYKSMTVPIAIDISKFLLR